ncbi:MAG: hypothetical protein M5U26_08525 [Planctomycetota bacterium]|nr:hypothetical protein [Planctomycetota bacterium]
MFHDLFRSLFAPRPAPKPETLEQYMRRLGIVAVEGAPVYLVSVKARGSFADPGSSEPGTRNSELEQSCLPSES